MIGAQVLVNSTKKPEPEAYLYILSKKGYRLMIFGSKNYTIIIPFKPDIRIHPVRAYYRALILCHLSYTV